MRLFCTAKSTAGTAILSQSPPKTSCLSERTTDGVLLLLSKTSEARRSCCKSSLVEGRANVSNFGGELSERSTRVDAGERDWTLWAAVDEPSSNWTSRRKSFDQVLCLFSSSALLPLPLKGDHFGGGGEAPRAMAWLRRLETMAQSASATLKTSLPTSAFLWVSPCAPVIRAPPVSTDGTGEHDVPESRTALEVLYCGSPAFLLAWETCSL